MTPSSGTKSRRRLTASAKPAQNCVESNSGELPLDKKLQSNLMTQSALVADFQAVGARYCEQHGLPPQRAKRVATRAAHELMGTAYKAVIPTPTVPPAVWSEREASDPDSDNPTKFLERHWGTFLDEDAVDQCTLRRLDVSLFDAIASYCRNRKLDPQDYLPPPARKQAKPQCSLPAANSAVQEHQTTNSTPHRPTTKRQAGGSRTNRSPKRHARPATHAATSAVAPG
jgi:hypothetical protein